jgi:hypothetical protein
MRMCNELCPKNIGTGSQVELLLLALFCYGPPFQNGVESFYNSVENCGEFLILAAIQFKLAYMLFYNICFSFSILLTKTWRRRKVDRTSKAVLPETLSGGPSPVTTLLINISIPLLYVALLLFKA